MIVQIGKNWNMNTWNQTCAVYMWQSENYMEQFQINLKFLPLLTPPAKVSFQMVVPEGLEMLTFIVAELMVAPVVEFVSFPCSAMMVGCAAKAKDASARNTVAKTRFRDNAPFMLFNGNPPKFKARDDPIVLKIIDHDLIRRLHKVVAGHCVLKDRAVLLP